MIEKIDKAIIELRRQKPLVLNLTNLVTMDFVANCLLALGAAPIMSVCEEELEELVTFCSVIYINIGTLDISFIELSKKAINFAKKHNKPIVLDPVGAGATKIRTQTAQYIAPYAAIIRGNASEIISLGNHSGNTKGVESTHTTGEAEEIASSLAHQYNTTVMISGPVDFITDGTRSVHVGYGSSLMKLVTGMGSAVTAVIGAFKAVIQDSFEASIIGAYYFDLCGEMVSLTYKHPGVFKSNFINQLHAADFEMMRRIYDR